MIWAAYLLGIIFDRFADSVLDDLSQRQLEDFRAKASDDYWQEPYSEARLRIAVLRAGGSPVEWHDYLRSRLRLSRAMAVFVPGLNFAIVLALRPQLSRWWLVAIPIAYAPPLLLRSENSDKSPPLAYDLLRYPVLIVAVCGIGGAPSCGPQPLRAVPPSPPDTNSCTSPVFPACGALRAFRLGFRQAEGRPGQWISRIGASGMRWQP